MLGTSKIILGGGVKVADGGGTTLPPSTPVDWSNHQIEVNIWDDDPNSNVWDGRELGHSVAVTEEITLTDRATSISFIIGATQPTNGPGRVIVVRHYGADWDTIQRIWQDDPTGGDDFGQSVSVTPNGQSLVVGAPDHARATL